MEGNKKKRKPGARAAAPPPSYYYATCPYGHCPYHVPPPRVAVLSDAEVNDLVTCPAGHGLRVSQAGPNPILSPAD